MASLAVVCLRHREEEQGWEWQVLQGHRSRVHVYRALSGGSKVGENVLELFSGISKLIPVN